MASQFPVLAALVVAVAASGVGGMWADQHDTEATPGRTTGGGTAANTRAWTWPLAPPVRVVRGFQPPAKPWLPGHRGVDLAASAGDSVRAAGAGSITFVGTIAGRGVVTIQHSELRTTYEPVRGLVTVGQRVEVGEAIGWLELGTGHCSGFPACLHWGLRRGSEYLDPLALVEQPYAVLLPLRPD